LGGAAVVERDAGSSAVAGCGNDSDHQFQISSFELHQTR